MHLIEFKKVKKSFDKKEVLKDVSFDVNEGEVFGLIGKSGGGKSTLLKILIGLLCIDSGEIIFEGKNALKKLNYLRKNTGFATQENMLFQELSVKENAFYFGDLYGMKKSAIKEEFDKLIKLLGLYGHEKTIIKNLSGGMQKRANILVSLIHKPKLLILDEPTVGLDSILRDILWKYIHEINKTGTTILVTSHLLDEIEENCDRIGILEKGEVGGVGTIKQYKTKFGKNKSLNQIFQEILK